MARDRRVTLFCEDGAHEAFLRGLFEVLLRARRVRASVDTVSACGGQGRALSELKAWQRAISKGLTAGVPDLLVVMIDANCRGPAKRDEIEQILDPALYPEAVIGCPEPHIERWALADPSAFKQVIGVPPPTDPGKCERGIYKRLLKQSVQRADLPVLGDPMEQLARDLVQAMDLGVAGRRFHELGRLIDEINAVISRWQA